MNQRLRRERGLPFPDSWLHTCDMLPDASTASPASTQTARSSAHQSVSAGLDAVLPTTRG